MIASLLASSVFVWKTFGLDFVLGVAPYWQTQTDDVTQYIAGFNMYFTAPWQWPLLAFNSLNYPDGTLVTFVDAIPLYALLLKTLLPGSWAPFNPFGGWVALCFLLQGFSAWWITRELRINNWFFLAALLVVFLTFPALMARIGHISLMSHWILLFAIALYVRGCRLNLLPRWGWTLLLVSAFYINIYLFVMASGVMLAGLFDLRRNLGMKDVAAFFLPMVILLAVAWVTFLPVPKVEITREWGFGYYSMNLLGPLTGGKIFALQVADDRGQYEGFNYLGLGVLVALLIAYWISDGLERETLRRHSVLFLLLVFYSIYALSNQVYFGGQQVLVLKYPELFGAITSQFRASGRFFWLVGYCLAVFSILVLYRRMGSWGFSLTVILLLVLQVSDLNERYKILRETVKHASPKAMNYNEFDNILGKQVETIYFYPKFKCAKDLHGKLLPVMRYASERGLNLNTGYIARYTPNCDDVATEIANSDTNRSAYIFDRTNYPDKKLVLDIFSGDVRINCSEVQFAHVCQTISGGEK